MPDARSDNKDTAGPSAKTGQVREDERGNPTVGATSEKEKAQPTDAFEKARQAFFARRSPKP